MVLAAVTVGLYMFGVVGGIIAIPIAGSIKVLVDEYLELEKEKDDTTPKDGGGDTPAKDKSRVRLAKNN